MSGDLIEQSYRCAALVARRSGSSFYRSFQLLPAEQRRNMLALYAFARITDDLSDDLNAAEQRSNKLEQLHTWRSVTARLLLATHELHASPPSSMSLSKWLESAGRSQTVPSQHLMILPALADTVRQRAIPSHYLLDLVDGVIVDQTKLRFQSFEQLEHYCYQVASTVGLSCVHIWGFNPPLPHTAAVDCGVAFQLTNIIRDIREDAARGRIYVPKEFWGNSPTAEQDFLEAQATPQVLTAIKTLTARARARYASGWLVADSLQPSGRRMFSMIWRTYRSLLSQIELDPTAPLKRRVRLSWSQRLQLIATHFIPTLYKRLPHPLEDPRFTSPASPTPTSSQSPLREPPR